MKRRMIAIGSALVAAVILFALIHTKDNNMFPMNAEDVAQMTVAINPYDTSNYTITDDKPIAKIIGSINDLGLQEADVNAKASLDETTYLLWFWYEDGSSDEIRMIRDDLIVAQDENGKKTYPTDCTGLLSILEATYWDRRNGEVE